MTKKKIIVTKRMLDLSLTNTSYYYSEYETHIEYSISDYRAYCTLYLYPNKVIIKSNYQTHKFELEYDIDLTNIMNLQYKSIYIKSFIYIIKNALSLANATTDTTLSEKTIYDDVYSFIYATLTKSDTNRYYTQSGHIEYLKFDTVNQVSPYSVSCICETLYQQELLLDKSHIAQVYNHLVNIENPTAEELYSIDKLKNRMLTEDITYYENVIPKDIQCDVVSIRKELTW